MSKQFNEFKKKVGKVAFTLALVGATTIGASAASKEAITTANLNMRFGESIKHKIVMTVPKGEKVNVLEDQGSWWKVEYKGKQGYSAKRYLVEVNNKEITADLKVTTKSGNLNVRTGPSKNYKVVGKVKNGTVLKATGKSGNWYEVNYNGQVGYVSSTYVKEVANNNNNNGGNQEVSTGKMKVTASSLRIRKGAGTNHATVGYLERNEEVTVLGKANNGWIKIQDKNGVVGYASTKYLVEVKDEASQVKPAEGQVKVTATNLNLRAGAGTGYKVLTVLAKDTVVEKIAVHANGWIQVRLANGTTGWISGEYVQDVKVEKPETNKPGVEDNTTPEQKPEVKPEEKPEVKPEDKPVVPQPPVEEEDKEENEKPEVKPEVKPEDKPVVPQPPVEDEKPENNKPGQGEEVVDEKPVLTVERTHVVKEYADSFAKSDLYIGVGHEEYGAKAYDKEDGDLTEDIIMHGNDNLSIVGTRDIVLSVTDSAGQTTSVTVSLTVLPKEENKEDDTTTPEQKPEEKPEEDVKPQPPVEEEDKEEVTPEPQPPVEEEDKEEVTPEPQPPVEDEEGDKEEPTPQPPVDEEGDKEEPTPQPPVEDEKPEEDVKPQPPVEDEKPEEDKEEVVKPGIINIAPELSAQDLVLTVGDKFDISMINAKATDKEDGDITKNIEVTHNVNTDEEGIYEVTLKITDSKGATTTKVVKVTVKAKPVVNNAPVLKVDNTTVTITEGGKFDISMFNATATDVEEGTLEIKLEGTYDVNKVGTYTLTLVAKDSKGLEARQEVKLVVEARKNTAPTVTANSIEITQGDNFSYEMLGAKATDAEGDKVTITYEGTVKTTEPGKYTITVIATDDRGAESRTTVTVTVKEAEKNSYDVNGAQFKNLVAQEMTNLVNAHRASNGIHALKLENKYVQSANYWSKYMADKNTFDHIINGKDAGDVCPSLEGIAVSENIAKCGFSSTGDMEQDAKNLANRLFNMWKNSPAHNAGMLSDWDSFFGFGFHAVDNGNGNYTIWATQHFDTNWETLPINE